MKTDVIRECINMVDIQYTHIWGEKLGLEKPKELVISDKANTQLTVLEARITELEEEDDAHSKLLEIQRSRMKGAEKAWQIAHNKPDTWPDLGELIQWMETEIAAKDEALRSTITFLRMYCPFAKQQLDLCEAALTPPTGKMLVERKELKSLALAARDVCKSIRYGQQPKDTDLRLLEYVFPRLAALLKD